MTVIAGYLTSEFGFLIGDTRHSISSKDGGPTTATITNADGTQINITAGKGINLDGKSKIFKYQDKYYFGGSGDFRKVEKFTNALFSTNPDSYIDFLNNFYHTEQDAPDLLMSIFHDETVGQFKLIYYQKYSNNGVTYTNKGERFPDENDIKYFSIGSGSDLLSQIYKKKEEEIKEKYLNAKKSGELNAFTEFFTNLVREMIKDAAKYDDTISEETNSIYLTMP